MSWIPAVTLNDRRSVTAKNISAVLATTFLLSGAVTFASSRGKHLAWPGFLFIGGVCLYAVYA
jgi:hypothetical protein